MRLLSVVGGRPHLIKTEALHLALSDHCLQHEMLRIRILRHSDYPNDADFQLPRCALQLEASDVASLSSAVGSALDRIRPDVLLVYGDLATTGVACRAGSRLGIPMVHVEAGYRNGDMKDPEEITRIAVDRECHAHIVYHASMAAALLNEGICSEGIFLAPDPMRLSLQRWHQQCDAELPSPGEGVLVTFHHDETLTASRIRMLIGELSRVAVVRPVTLIAYERTMDALARAGQLGRVQEDPRIRLTETLPFRSYIRELVRSRVVVTDSSGVQDDCVTLGKPYVVLRSASPRPVRRPMARAYSESAGLAGAIAAVEHRQISQAPRGQRDQQSLAGAVIAAAHHAVRAREPECSRAAGYRAPVGAGSQLVGASQP